MTSSRRRVSFGSPSDTSDCVDDARGSCSAAREPSPARKAAAAGSSDDRLLDGAEGLLMTSRTASAVCTGGPMRGSLLDYGAR